MSTLASRLAGVGVARLAEAMARIAIHWAIFMSNLDEKLYGLFKCV
jgi:hypothetical protein